MTAVCPVVIKGNGLWVGWPGIYSKEPLGPIPESDPSDQTPTAGLKSDQVSTRSMGFSPKLHLVTITRIEMC